MSLTTKLSRMENLAKLVNTKLPDKDKISGLDNIKPVIKKGLEGKLLTNEQYKTLSNFFLNIIPEFSEPALQSKMVKAVKLRKNNE